MECVALIMPEVLCVLSIHSRVASSLSQLCMLFCCTLPFFSATTT